MMIIFISFFNVLQHLLHHRFAVKLQKCFVDYKTSHDFPSALEWVDNN